MSEAGSSGVDDDSGSSGGDGTGEDKAVRPRGRRPSRAAANPRGTVPERLSYLFATVYPVGRGVYSPAEVAREITEGPGEGKISEVYVQKILNGERPDPHPRYLGYLAQFFGESLSYFYDDERPVDPETLRELATMRNPMVRRIAMRSAQMSPTAMAAVDTIITQVLRAEGKIIEDPGK